MIKEVKGDILGQTVLTTASPGGDGGDDDLPHRDDNVLEGRAAGLTNRQNTLVYMRTRMAMLKKTVGG